jgi:hypothetical protein
MHVAVTYYIAQGHKRTLCYGRNGSYSENILQVY